MALTRVTKAEGTIEVAGFAEATVRVDFEYTQAAAPSRIHFTIGLTDGTWIDGNFSGGKITSYNVSNGIVTDELMSAVQGAIITVNENYETA